MMALKLFLIFAFITGFIDANPLGYTYISSARAYYKYHTKGAKWADAVSTCRSEGARLFHPDSAEELETVLRVLAVGDNGGSNSLFTGLSDLDKLRDYKTVDGRPISQVYNKWSPGYPYSGGNVYRCGGLVVSTRLIYNDYCDYTWYFICKHEEEVTERDEKTVTAANASYVAALEQQLANQSAAVEVLKQEAVSLNLQVANQTAAIEVMQREIEAMKKVHAENQPSALLEKIVLAIANQTAAMQQQTAVIKQQDANQAAALDRLTEALQRHAANQTAAVERLALAMEKLAGTQENNEQ